MIWFIEQLIKKEYAYTTNEGSVYFDLEKYKIDHKYPKLIPQLNSDENDNIPFYDKKHINDFALWKSVNDEKQGIKTKFGLGKWGWHLECSAMSYFTLNGNFTFDIHGGGLDLKFPHHENEIAQSEALIDKKYVNYWVHNGLVSLQEGYKINKADCNKDLYLENILTKYHKDVIRYWMLNSHYRSDLIFSVDILDEFKNIVDNIYTNLMIDEYDKFDFSIENIDVDIINTFNDYMNDDFNTHSVLILLNSLLSKKDYHSFKYISNVLNLFQETPENFLHRNDIDFNLKIEELLSKRDLYRKNKDFKNSDIIKKQLKSLGVDVLDTKNKTYWKK